MQNFMFMASTGISDFAYDEHAGSFQLMLLKGVTMVEIEASLAV